MFICFVGIDGSGKTLQAKRLAERLKAQGIDCTYTWCRYSPRVTMPFIRAAKALFSRSGKKSAPRDDSGYEQFISSKRDFLRNPFFGALWLHSALLEYFWQATWKVRLPLMNGKLLICDRYVYDEIADLAVGFGHTGKAVTSLARHLFIRLLPVPDKVFFLDIPPEVSLQRKDDPGVMGEGYLRDRAVVYRLLSDAMGFTRLDGEQSIEEIADRIWAELPESIKGAQEVER